MFVTDLTGDLLEGPPVLCMGKSILGVSSEIDEIVGSTLREMFLSLILRKDM